MTATKKRENNNNKKKTLLAVLRLFRGPSFNWLGHRTLTHTSPTYLVRSDWTWRLANRTLVGEKKRNGVAKSTKKWQTWREFGENVQSSVIGRQHERHKEKLKAKGGCRDVFERFDTGDSWKAQGGLFFFILPPLFTGIILRPYKNVALFSLAWPPPLFVEGGEVRFPISPLVHWTLTEK
jgi:hypothetical protein